MSFFRPKNPRFGLKASLLWRFLVVSVLPLAVVGLLNHYFVTRDLQAEIKARNLLFAQTLRRDVEGMMGRPLSILRQTAVLLEPAGADRRVPVQGLLETAAKSCGLLEAVALLDRQGVIRQVGFAKSDGRPAYLPGEPFPLPPGSPGEEKNGAATWSGTFVSPLSNKATLAVFFPLREGWMAGSLSLDPLFSALKPEELMPGLGIWVSDREGRTLFSTLPPQNGSRDWGGEIIPSPEGSGQAASFLYARQEEEFLASVVPLPELGWRIGVSQAAGEAFGTVQEVWESNFVGLLLVLITTGLGAAALLQRLTHSFSQLAVGVRSIAGGEFDNPLPAQEHRELEELAENVRAMARAIQQREAALRESQERFRSIFRHAGAGMNTISPEGRFIEVNPAICRFLGYEADELKTLLVGDVTHPDDRSITVDFYRRVEAGQCDTFNYEKRFIRKDGATVWGYVTTAWLFDPEGRPTYAVALVQDITERKEAEQAVLRERTFLQTVIDGAVDPLMVIGLDYRVLLMNRAARENLPEELRGRGGLTCYQATHGRNAPCNPDDRPCPIREVSRTRTEMMVVHPQLGGDGRMRILEMQASPLWGEDGSLLGVIEGSRDITARLQVEEKLRENQFRLEHMAHHDVLTGLPNRLLLLDRLGHAMAKARRAGERLAVLFLDLDRFKHINDSLGHTVGDRLLQEMSERLRRCVRETDTVARLGGDEFVVVLEGVGEKQDIVHVANKILRWLPQPFVVDHRPLFVTPSIGISLFPEDAEDPEGLLRCADLAMYQAKDEGRNNHQFYTPEMNDRAERLFLLESDLRQALELGELGLHYQPQVDLASGRLTGMEALLRWHHPKMGMIPPDYVIPLAEETGLIFPIGEWALLTACAQNRRWQQQGFAPVRMAVNISGRQFRDTGFAHLVQGALAETGLDPRWLELEITESIVMANVAENIRNLQTLRSMGVSLSVDDFGTGYSSLSYLKRFPIDKLKIDKSFVHDVDSGANEGAIAAAVIALGKSLNLEVVAEGIETRAQLDFLLDRGCNRGQGFLFSPPKPAEALGIFLLGQKPGVDHARALTGRLN